MPGRPVLEFLFYVRNRDRSTRQRVRPRGYIWVRGECLAILGAVALLRLGFVPNSSNIGQPKFLSKEAILACAPGSTAG